MLCRTSIIIIAAACIIILVVATVAHAVEYTCSGGTVLLDDQKWRGGNEISVGTNTPIEDCNIVIRDINEYGTRAISGIRVNKCAACSLTIENVTAASVQLSSSTMKNVSIVGLRARFATRGAPRVSLITFTSRSLSIDALLVRNCRFDFQDAGFNRVSLIFSDAHMLFQPQASALQAADDPPPRWVIENCTVTSGENNHVHPYLLQSVHLVEVNTTETASLLSVQHLVLRHNSVFVNAAVHSAAPQFCFFCIIATTKLAIGQTATFDHNTMFVDVGAGAAEASLHGNIGFFWSTNDAFVPPVRFFNLSNNNFTMKANVSQLNGNNAGFFVFDRMHELQTSAAAAAAAAGAGSVPLFLCEDNTFSVQTHARLAAVQVGAISTRFFFLSVSRGGVEHRGHIGAVPIDVVLRRNSNRFIAAFVMMSPTVTKIMSGHEFSFFGSLFVRHLVHDANNCSIGYASLALKLTTFNAFLYLWNVTIVGSSSSSSSNNNNSGIVLTNNRDKYVLNINQMTGPWSGRHAFLFIDPAGDNSRAPHVVVNTSARLESNSFLVHRVAESVLVSSETSQLDFFASLVRIDEPQSGYATAAHFHHLNITASTVTVGVVPTHGQMRVNVSLVDARAPVSVGAGGLRVDDGCVVRYTASASAERSLGGGNKRNDIIHVDGVVFSEAVDWQQQQENVPVAVRISDLHVLANISTHRSHAKDETALVVFLWRQNVPTILTSRRKLDLSVFRSSVIVNSTLGPSSSANSVVGVLSGILFIFGELSLTKLWVRQCVLHVSTEHVLCDVGALDLANVTLPGQYVLLDNEVDVEARRSERQCPSFTRELAVLPFFAPRRNPSAAWQRRVFFLRQLGRDVPPGGVPTQVGTVKIARNRMTVEWAASCGAQTPQDIVEFMSLDVVTGQSLKMSASQLFRVGDNTLTVGGGGGSSCLQSRFFFLSSHNSATSRATFDSLLIERNNFSATLNASCCTNSADNKLSHAFFFVDSSDMIVVETRALALLENRVTISAQAPTAAGATVIMTVGAAHLEGLQFLDESSTVFDRLAQLLSPPPPALLNISANLFDLTSLQPTDRIAACKAIFVNRKADCAFIISHNTFRFRLAPNSHPKSAFYALHVMRTVTAVDFIARDEHRISDNVVEEGGAGGGGHAGSLSAFSLIGKFQAAQRFRVENNRVVSEFLSLFVAGAMTPIYPHVFFRAYPYGGLGTPGNVALAAPIVNISGNSWTRLVWNEASQQSDDESNITNCNEAIFAVYNVNTSSTVVHISNNNIKQTADLCRWLHVWTPRAATLGGSMALRVENNTVRFTQQPRRPDTRGIRRLALKFFKFSSFKIDNVSDIIIRGNSFINICGQPKTTSVINAVELCVDNSTRSIFIDDNIVTLVPQRGFAGRMTLASISNCPESLVEEGSTTPHTIDSISVSRNTLACRSFMPHSGTEAADKSAAAAADDGLALVKLDSSYLLFSSFDVSSNFLELSYLHVFASMTLFQSTYTVTSSSSGSLRVSSNWMRCVQSPTEMTVFQFMPTELLTKARGGGTLIEGNTFEKMSRTHGSESTAPPPLYKFGIFSQPASNRALFRNELLRFRMNRVLGSFSDVGFALNASGRFASSTQVAAVFFQCNSPASRWKDPSGIISKLKIFMGGVDTAVRDCSLTKTATPIPPPTSTRTRQTQTLTSSEVASATTTNDSSATPSLALSRTQSDAASHTASHEASPSRSESASARTRSNSSVLLTESASRDSMSRSESLSDPSPSHTEPSASRSGGSASFEATISNYNKSATKSLSETESIHHPVEKSTLEKVAEGFENAAVIASALGLPAASMSFAIGREQALSRMLDGAKNDACGFAEVQDDGPLPFSQSPTQLELAAAGRFRYVVGAVVGNIALTIGVSVAMFAIGYVYFVFFKRAKNLPLLAIASSSYVSIAFLVFVSLLFGSTLHHGVSLFFFDYVPAVWLGVTGVLGVLYLGYIAAYLKFTLGSSDLWAVAVFEWVDPPELDDEEKRKLRAQSPGPAVAAAADDAGEQSLLGGAAEPRSDSDDADNDDDDDLDRYIFNYVRANTSMAQMCMLRARNFVSWWVDDFGVWRYLPAPRSTTQQRLIFGFSVPILESYVVRSPRFFLFELTLQAAYAGAAVLASLVGKDRSCRIESMVCGMCGACFLGALLYLKPVQPNLAKYAVLLCATMEIAVAILATTVDASSAVLEHLGSLLFVSQCTITVVMFLWFFHRVYQMVRRRGGGDGGGDAPGAAAGGGGGGGATRGGAAVNSKGDSVLVSKLAAGDERQISCVGLLDRPFFARADDSIDAGGDDDSAKKNKSSKRITSRRPAESPTIFSSPTFADPDGVGVAIDGSDAQEMLGIRSPSAADDDDASTSRRLRLNLDDVESKAAAAAAVASPREGDDAVDDADEHRHFHHQQPQRRMQTLEEIERELNLQTHRYEV